VSRRGKDIGRYLGGKQKKGKKKEGKGKKKELKPTRNQGRKPKYVPKVFDLHEKALFQAKEYIKEKIQENISRKSCLHFIHGHTHGDKIRTYLRDGGLQSWIDSQEISVEIWFQDNGTTFVESK